jgi:CRISPR-associated protein Cmr1
MNLLRYRVQFTTPAFLGNAEQAGQWRTPPFKALLRQWWRVVFAADRPGAITDGEIRAAEADLFGVAGDGGDKSQSSRVRIRLDRWDQGSMRSWSGLEGERVIHREVRGRDGRLVGAHLYLGYGPLSFAQGQTALKAAAAIQAGESGGLRLALPSGQTGRQLEAALSLMHLYGTIGGRSRNGWGSFSLVPEHGPRVIDPELHDRILIDWKAALKRDWPHAIGRGDDGRALIWQTAAFRDWPEVMRCLAKVKIELRTHFAFPNAAGPHATPQERHWLSYPVTHHGTAAWDRNARLPNSLRFKVRLLADGSLCGVIFHVPCMPPRRIFGSDPKVLEEVWRKVHQRLDRSDHGLLRIAG